MATLWCAASAVLAMPLSLLPAVAAHADQDAVDSYVSEHGGEVCGLMHEQPGLPGVRNAIDHIVTTSGLPQDQTGPVLGASVTTHCPDSAESVREFVWYAQHHQLGGLGTGVGAILGR